VLCDGLPRLAPYAYSFYLQLPANRICLPENRSTVIGGQPFSQVAHYSSESKGFELKNTIGGSGYMQILCGDRCEQEEQNECGCLEVRVRW